MTTGFRALVNSLQGFWKTRCLLICFSRKAEELCHIKLTITDWVINRVSFLELYRPSLPTSLTAMGKEKQKLADRRRRHQWTEKGKRRTCMYLNWLLIDVHSSNPPGVVKEEIYRCAVFLGWQRIFFRSILSGANGDRKLWIKNCMEQEARSS